MVPETAHARSRLLAQIRAFFDQRGVLAVETPSLARGAAPDRHLDPFQLHNGERLLPTSPELHMKRLLADGYPDIYQICHAFRCGERGRQHNPEFTILEWYRRGFTMQRLMDEVAALCRTVAGERSVVCQGYCDVFRQNAGIDPLETSNAEIVDVCSRTGGPPPPLESRTDLLQYAMAQIVEPRLPSNAFVFIHHFPAEQAILAKLAPDDPRTALRFELYCNGLELANGWEELTDPDENRIRFETQNELRRAAGQPTVPVDECFLDALRRGMPDCAGVALGIDRLIMLALGMERIDEVVTFPWEEA